MIRLFIHAKAQRAQRKEKIFIMDENALSKEIIGAAIEVHKALGPGLLESAYEECLCRELILKELYYQRQVPVPIAYKGIKLECGYQLDVLVENKVVIEIKSVENLMPVHKKQLLTYLRLLDKRFGITDKLQ